MNETALCKLLKGTAKIIVENSNEKNKGKSENFKRKINKVLK